jgi:hypothetical protein
MPMYLCDVVRILACWQIGTLDDNKLYDAFEKFDCMVDGDITVRCRIVNLYAYCWWKDRFDLGPFQMPNRISLLEVKELVEEHFDQLVSTSLRNRQDFSDLCVCPACGSSPDPKAAPDAHRQ